MCAYLLGLPTGKIIIHHYKVWSNIFWNELGTNVGVTAEDPSVLSRMIFTENHINFAVKSPNQGCVLKIYDIRK